MEHELSSKHALSVLVLAFVIAFYLFANSSVFETDCVEWTGLVYLDSEQLDIYLDFSSINVWRLNTNDVVKILTQHPWIKTAKLRWRWPNRIIVTVQERTPVAQLPSAGGWLLLEKEGNLLPPTQGAIIYPLPIVTNLDLNSSEQLIATSRLMSIIPDSLKPILSEWNVQTRSFISRTGTEIMMGQPVNLDEKFLLLEKIIDDLASRSEQASKIDLRVLKSPVVNVL